jgi:hypothetical protein
MPNDNPLISSHAAQEPGLLGAGCDLAAVDDEPWPTPVGDEMLVFDITDTLEEQPPRKKAYLDPSDPCLFDVMDNDSEHEQPDVISCCHPERYVGLNASILEFSIRLAAAIQQRDKCFSDLVQPEASPVVQHQPHKGVRRKPFRITICQLTVLTMVAHRRDLSKRTSKLAAVPAPTLTIMILDLFHTSGGESGPAAVAGPGLR